MRPHSFNGILHNCARKMPHVTIMYMLTVVDKYLSNAKKTAMQCVFLLASIAKN